jgi:hypothetical protein
MPRARAAMHAGAMKAQKWLILGALAGLVAVQVNKQMRLARHRAQRHPDATGSASIDDVPTVQPASDSFVAIEAYDERIAPSAPL